jgi:electron transfer flavoprotein alpha subunit
MSDFHGVWVYSESIDLMLELLTKATELAGKLNTETGALLIGHDLRTQADRLAGSGADKVFMLDNPALKVFNSEIYLGALTAVVKERKPETILFGSTRKSKELAARLATRLETGCVPDCTNLSLDDQGRLISERVVYGGNGSASLVFLTKPQIVCVPPRTFEKAGQTGKKGEIVEVNVAGFETPKTETVEVKPLEVGGGKLEEAKVIIVGGRGIEKQEDFKILESLSYALGGQVGYTRPLAEDRKWFKGDWIGLSGIKIKPVLYIGAGVSGVIQHVAGIRDSQVIVAINTDEQAPIFEMADYIVVGDLYEIVPALEAALKKLLAPS